MGKTYVGNSSGVAKVPKKIYAGNSSNVAKAVKVVYCGNSSDKAVEVWRNSTLPSTYQKVEYIFNSGGTQYIDTGVKPNSDTDILMEFMLTGSSIGSSQYGFFGTCKTGRNGAYFVYQNTYSIYYYNSYITFEFGGSNWDTPSMSIAHNEKYVVEIKKGKFYKNGNLINTSTKTFTDTAYNALLFGRNYSTENADPVVEKFPEGLRLYHFQMWKSGSMIRNMYPCYLKSDSQTVGMYDLVNGKFYGNSGTGIFYKGPDVD